MKTVKVYIETTITGPSKPKYGKYAAALAFTRKNGKTEDRFLQGSEQETTYNRSVLLAMVRAMQRFTESCHIIFYTRIDTTVVYKHTGKGTDQRDREEILPG